MKKEQLTFAGGLSDPPCWLSREHLPIVTPKAVVGSYVELCFGFAFFQGQYIVAMSDVWVVYYVHTSHTRDQVSFCPSDGAVEYTD